MSAEIHCIVSGKVRKRGALSQGLAGYFEFMKNSDKVYSSCKEEGRDLSGLRLENYIRRDG